jgi:hypothetical protein
VTKAIVLLGPDGVALAPAILCADDPAEASEHSIPLFEQVFAQLSAGMELRSSGDSTYELYEKGRRIGLLEVLERPAVDGKDGEA